MICLQGEERLAITLPDLEHMMSMPLVLSDETVDLVDTQQMIRGTRTNILTEHRQTQICEISPDFHLCWTAQCLHALERLINGAIYVNI